MKVMLATDLDPGSLKPGDCLADIKNRLYLIVAVIKEKNAITLVWFRGNKLNQKSYSK